MRIEELRLDLEKLKREAKLREIGATTRISPTSIEHRGKKLIDFTNWDVLGISAHPSLRRIGQQFLEQNDFACCSSRHSSGTTQAHINCEKRISAFFGTESALLFPSKNQALLSLVTTIANERDLFLISENSQSIVPDAAYLVNAQVELFRDLGTLERAIERTSLARNRYLVIDTVSPLSGDLYDLAPLQSLCTRHGVNLVIDESAALGTVGARGAGGSEILADLMKQPAGKSLFAGIVDFSRGGACFGGAVFGSAVLITYLLHYSRASRNEMPLPPLIAAMIERSLDTIELSFTERSRVIDRAQRLRKMIPSSYLLSRIESSSAIVVLGFKHLRVANEIALLLLNKGFLVEQLSSAQHLQEQALLRMIVNAGHTEKEIDDLGKALSEALTSIEKR